MFPALPEPAVRALLSPEQGTVGTWRTVQR